MASASTHHERTGIAASGARYRGFERLLTDWRPFGLLLVGLVLVFGGMRIYQGAFAWTKGLDATSRDFALYWRTLLAANLVVFGGGTVAWWAHLARTRCAECASAAEAGTAAAHEEQHIKRLWALIAGWTVSLYFMGGFFGEQDAAWHQTAIRDTAFTPSHIVLFYAAFPLGITFALGSYLYARTRLPQLYGPQRGVPVSFLLIGFGAVLLMIQVALNEWAHSLFQTEELFAAPLHWPFVAYGYLAAGTFAIWFETVGRLFTLKDQEEVPGELEPIDPQDAALVTPQGR